MPHIHEKIDFTVEVFVVYKKKVLLRIHDKAKIWLSVGGHIELDEDPNEAAIREVKEEVGLDIILYDNREFKHKDEQGQELIAPMFLKRHFMSNAINHEHIVLTYIASSLTDNVIPEKTDDQWKWVTQEELEVMDLKPDIKFYAEKALEILGNK